MAMGMRFLPRSIHHVAICVNTARIDPIDTSRIMGDDRARKQGKRLAEARRAAGYRSAREAAIANGWPESTYRAHENGTRTIGQDDAERYARRFRYRGANTSAQAILFGDDMLPEPAAGHVIPIVGRVGAGAEIGPDYEQIPAEGIEQIELPFPAPHGMIGFRIVGNSMAPTYEENAIVLVAAEPPLAVEGMIGMAAAVLCETREGEKHRYLKRIRRGTRPHMFTLESINDRSPTIDNVRIIWASPVLVTVSPNAGLRSVAKDRGRRSR